MQKSQSDITSTFKHASIYAAVSILEKAVGFIMLPFYAHLLGAEGYGILGMIEVFTSILDVLVTFGIASAINRFYFERTSEEDRKTFISTAVLTMLLFSVITCLPCFFLNKPISLLAFGSKDFGIYIILAAISFMANATTYSGQQYLLINQKSILIATLSILRLVLGLFLNIYLIVILRMGVIGVLYSQLITSVINSLFYQIYALSRTGIHFKKKDSLEILRFSLPLLPGYLAVFVRSNADKVILRSLLGLSKLGVYSIVMKFSVLIGLFVFQPFMKTWIPKRMEICNTPRGPQTISKMVTIHLSLMLFAGLILAIELPMLLEILTPMEFWVPSIVGFIAVFSRVSLNSYYHFMFGLLYGKKTFKISIIQITVALISIPMYWLLIRNYSITGAFLAALIAFVLQSGLAWYLSRPYYNILYEWRKIFLATAFAFVLFIVISPISIKHTVIAAMIDHNITPLLNKIIFFFGFESLLQGKLLAIANDKLIVITDGLIKGLLCMTYLIALSFCKILPKDKTLLVLFKILGFILNIAKYLKRPVTFFLTGKKRTY
jgi:O-antigen/teichoic acid export membrane protein